jgi:hypothetical protein
MRLNQNVQLNFDQNPNQKINSFEEIELKVFTLSKSNHLCRKLSEARLISKKINKPK